MKFAITLLVCLYLSIASGATCYLNASIAQDQCNSSCSFFDPSIWDSSLPPSCNGTDIAILDATQFYHIIINLIFDISCNISTINSTYQVNFEIPNGINLYVGNLNFEDRLTVNGTVAVWNSMTTMTGTLYVQQGGTFYYYGPNPMSVVYGSSFDVFGNFTISSSAQARLQGSLTVYPGAVFTASSISFIQPANVLFLSSPTLLNTASITGATVNFSSGVSANILNIISSIVTFYDFVDVSTFSGDTASQVFFVKANATFQQAALSGNITINSSSIYYKVYSGKPSNAPALVFAGVSNLISESELVFPYATYQPVGAFNDATNVTISATFLSTIQSSLPIVPIDIPIAQINCSDLRTQILSVNSVNTYSISTLTNLTTKKGLVIRKQYDPINGAQINSTVILENSNMVLNNSTVIGNITLRNFAILTANNSSIIGVIHTHDNSSANIYASSIIESIDITDNSSVFIQNSSITDLLSNNATLTLDGAVSAGNYSQTSIGELIFNYIDFSGPPNSANHLNVSGTVTLNKGVISCTIVNNTLFNLTKVIFLIYGDKINGEFKSSRSIGASFNTTELTVRYPDNTRVSIRVKFDMVTVWFAVGAAGFALVAAFIFIFLTRAPKSNPQVIQRLDKRNSGTIQADPSAGTFNSF